VSRFDLLRDKRALLRQALIEKDYSLVARIIKQTGSYDQAEFIIHEVFEQNTSKKIVDLALNTFLKTHQLVPLQHGYWVHSLTHFDETLWERGEREWLKKLYQVAFDGAHKLGEATCCDVLIYRFCEYAQWSDNSADYGLQISVISWMKWYPKNKHIKERVEIGRFNSESEYLRWQFQNPEVLYEYRNTQLVSIGRIRNTILRLARSGEDVTEFLELEDQLLRVNLQDQLRKLEETDNKYDQERLQKSIKMLQWALHECD